MSDSGPVYLGSPKKSLEDVGTRFSHVNDLLDYLGDGLIAVNNSFKMYKNENDKLRADRLQTAIIMIEVYRDHLANRDGNACDFNLMLDSCAPDKAVMLQIRQEKIDALKKTQKTEKPEEGGDEITA